MEKIERKSIGILIPVNDTQSELTYYDYVRLSDVIALIDQRIEKYKARTMFENSPDLIAYRELESLKQALGERKD